MTISLITKNQRTMRDVVINEVLFPSLRKLYEIDYDNIHFGVSERNICARLAHHIENCMREYDKSHESNLFQNYYADVEYNRMGNGNLKRYENSEHRPRYMVSDLLIQKRGYGRNLLAVEVKRKENKRNVEEDKARLKSLVSSPTNDASNECVHDTLVGAFITYSPNGVVVEMYENVNGKGEKFKESYWDYQQHYGLQLERVV